MNENEYTDPERLETTPLSSPEEEAESADENTSEAKNVTRPRLRARRTIAPPEHVESAAEGQELPEEKATGGNTPEETPADADGSTESAGINDGEGSLDDPGEDNAASKEERFPASVSAFDWIKSILLSFAAVIFTFTVLFRGSTVVGNSMRDTLHNGERVIISDFLYTPKTGDIVVVHTPTYKNGEDFLIKRVIALGGQTVRIDFNSWEVSVDGVLLDEPYVLKQNEPMIRESMEPDENGVVEFTVKENHVFVMGDNRNDSLDSRSSQVGEINRQYILGRVILRYLPFDVFGPVA